MSAQTRADPSGLFTKNLVLACLINGAIGVLYLWSLFLLPLESKLAVDRSTLSVAASLALVTFTCGMAAHDHILTRIPPRLFALLSFVLAGGGHLLFSWAPNIWSLVVGYGVLFGFGAGLSYGLALALATRAAARVRAMSVGIVVSAFAGGGLIVSSVAGSAISAADPQISFAVIGTALLGIGAAAALSLDKRLLAQPSSITEFSQNVTVLSPGLLALIFIFFLISYVGLMTVSHITTMLSAKEVAAQLAALGPVVVTLGYLIGSFWGGKLVEAIGGWPVLILASVLNALGLMVLALPIGSWALFTALIVGTVFGSSASFMPVIIGEQFGVHQIGLIYGKVMFSYGGAGLLAPWITGRIFVKTGVYALALLIGIAGSILGAVIGLMMARSSRV